MKNSTKHQVTQLAQKDAQSRYPVLVQCVYDALEVVNEVLFGARDARRIYKLARLYCPPRRRFGGSTKLTEREVELCDWLARYLSERIQARVRNKKGDRKFKVRVDERPIDPPRIPVTWALDLDLEVSTFEEFTGYVALAMSDRRLIWRKIVCRCRKCEKFFLPDDHLLLDDRWRAKLKPGQLPWRCSSCEDQVRAADTARSKKRRKAKAAYANRPPVDTVELPSTAS